MDNQQLLYVFNKLVNEDFIPESDRIMLGEKVFISGHTALQVVTIDKHKNLAIMLIVRQQLMKSNHYWWIYLT